MLPTLEPQFDFKRMKHKKTNSSPQEIIQKLARNRAVFEALLAGQPTDLQTWKDQPDRWSLLEIVCHLFDEEREDFRQRTRLILQDPTQPLPPIDPTGWVEKRAYAKEDYSERVQAFLNERTASIVWLSELNKPVWDNCYQHPHFGPMTATLYLHNWLAHDYLHMRQITRLQFDYLAAHSPESLDYAGNW
jgi:hypothetical protein